MHNVQFLLLIYLPPFQVSNLIIIIKLFNSLSMNRRNRKLILSSNASNKKLKHAKLSMQNNLKRNGLITSLFTLASSLPPYITAAILWDNYVQMYNIIEQLIRIEVELKIPLPKRNKDTVLQLENWAKENGAQLNNCKISEFEGYDYGLLATDNIEVESIITSVPKKLMITVDCIKGSPLETLFNEDVLLLQLPYIALAIFLLVERFRTDKPSFWLPYFLALPKTYTTCMYFSVDDLKELKGSPALESALKMHKNIARQYCYFWNVFQRSTDEASNILRDVFTYEQYRWAVSTVMTRQNYIPGRDKTFTYVIIPVWDFCNHSNNEDKSNTLPSTSYDEETESCVCVAPRRFTKGQQINIFYGERSNADFLIHNGFVYPENHHDVLKVKFGISNSDSSVSRLDLLTKLKLPPSGEYLIRADKENPIHPSALAFVRIFTMDEKQLVEWMDREDMEGKLLGPVGSVSNSFDVQVLQYIQTRMNILLKAYPTTLQNDESILKQKELPHIKKLLVLQRITEKRILSSACVFCSEKIAELKLQDTTLTG